MRMVAALLMAAAFGLAGCDGRGEPGAGVSVAPSGVADPLAYAQCMRRNGVAKFPDPAEDGSLKFSPKDGIDPDSPEFRAADGKCKQYLPAGEKNQTPGEDPWTAELKLQYAGCMRANGVPSFPDPDADNRFPQLEQGGPIDPDSALFQKADAACARYKPQNMGGRG